MAKTETDRVLTDVGRGGWSWWTLAHSPRLYDLLVTIPYVCVATVMGLAFGVHTAGHYAWACGLVYLPLYCAWRQLADAVHLRVVGLPRTSSDIPDPDARRRFMVECVRWFRANRLVESSLRYVLLTRRQRTAYQHAYDVLQDRLRGRVHPFVSDGTTILDDDDQKTRQFKTRARELKQDLQTAIEDLPRFDVSIFVDRKFPVFVMGYRTILVALLVQLATAMARV